LWTECWVDVSGRGGGACVGCGGVSCIWWVCVGGWWWVGVGWQRRAKLVGKVSPNKRRSSSAFRSAKVDGEISML